MGRRLQTHMVRSGRFEISGYLDDSPGGPVIRALSDGEIVARFKSGRWSRPVKEAPEPPPRVYPAPRGPAVQVVLDKGQFY